MKSKRYSNKKDGTIFISYKREEVDQARMLYEKLTELGYNVWWDADIQCGQVWNEVLDREVKNANCIVVLWSYRAMKSKWVMHEASSAMDRGVYAPARIKLCEIDAPYNRLQATDLMGWDGISDHPGFQSLLVRINELLPPKKNSSEKLIGFVRSNLALIGAILFGVVSLCTLLVLTLAVQSQLLQMKGIYKEQNKAGKKVESLLDQMKEIGKEQNQAREKVERLLVQIQDVGNDVNATSKELNQLIDDFNKSVEIQNQLAKSNDTINSTVKSNLETQRTTYLKSLELNILQNEALKKQAELLNQQNSIHKSINRSLNPLVPFALRYSIKLKPTENADTEAGSYAFSQSWKVYNKIRKMIDKRTKDEANGNFSSMDYPGVFTLHKQDTIASFTKTPPPYAYLITPSFKGFFDFNFRVALDINFCINSPDAYGSNCEFQATAYSRAVEMDEKYIVHDNNNYGIYLYYLIETEEIEIYFYSEEISVKNDLGKFKSLLDLKDAHIYADIAGLPTGAEFNSVVLFFGPNYARRINIDLKQKGKTTVPFDVLKMSNKIERIE